MQTRGDTKIAVILEGVGFYALKFRAPVKRLSDAPYNGGTGISETYVNLRVPMDYNGNVETDVKNFLALHDFDQSRTTVTLTACDTAKAKHGSGRGSSFSFQYSLTVGAGNALSIGSSGKTGPGTVNIAVVTDAVLDVSAQLNLFQGITEAKSQAFNDAGIVDGDTGKLAPGTSTDTVSIFLDETSGKFQYGGRLSEIGRIISTEIYRQVLNLASGDCL